MCHSGSAEEKFRPQHFENSSVRKTVLNNIKNFSHHNMNHDGVAATHDSPPLHVGIHRLQRSREIIDKTSELLFIAMWKRRY